jgi:hypothetical protein
MYFMLRDGWYCQFLEADLKTALLRTFTFATLRRWWSWQSVLVD